MIYSKSEVFEAIKKVINKKRHFEIDGHRYSINKKLKLFYYKGCVCVSCGVEGDHFVNVFEKTSPHDTFSNTLQLVTTNSRFLTMDHIVPKSLSGSDSIENLQAMCNVCNTHKDNLCYHTDYKYNIQNIFSCIEPEDLFLNPQINQIKGVIACKLQNFRKGRVYPVFVADIDEVRLFIKEIHDEFNIRVNEHRIPKISLY